MLRRDFCRSIIVGSAVLAAPTVISAQASFASERTPGEALTELPFGMPAQRSMATSLSFLDDSSAGETYDLAGTVRSQRGGTISDALLYVWQVDETGAYDRANYRYHGVALTDAKGRFELSSIIPSGYSASARQRRGHLHVAVMPPEGEILSTELFFPLESHAAIIDPDFDPRLLVGFKTQHQARNLATVEIVV